VLVLIVDVIYTSIHEYTGSVHAARIQFWIWRWN